MDPAEPHDFTLFLRIPGWTESAGVFVNGKRAAGTARPGSYFELRRRWTRGDTVRLSLNMDPAVLVAHPRVMDAQGRVAVRRGPLVYVVEQAGQGPGINVLETFLRLTGDPVKDFRPEFRPSLLGGVVVLKHKGLRSALPFSDIRLYERLGDSRDKPGQPADLELTPYYTFLNRGPSAMQVWTRFVR